MTHQSAVGFPHFPTIAWGDLSYSTLGLENVVMGFSDDHEEFFPHFLHFNLIEIM